MATVADIARDLLGSMASDTSMPVAVRWIDNRYKEMVSKVRFRHLRKIGTLVIPPQVRLGTVSVTLGSANVVGTDTTWATSPGVFLAGAQPYWGFRASGVWYEVNAVSGNTALSLVSAYAETSNAAATYHLVKRYHALAPGARWLGGSLLPRLRKDLGDPVGLDELNSWDAQRILVGQPPMAIAQVHNSPDGYLMVEAYPYAKDTELLNYVYWEIPSELGVTSEIPRQVDPYVLKEGAYVDYCRHMMATREREGKMELTGFWRNEFRAADTRWNAIMRDAVRTDRGVDDMSFLLQRSGGAPFGRSFETRAMTVE